MKFTEEQKQVIFCFQGPMMVLACPGSGKTMTIIGRAAVLREKFPKDNILYIDCHFFKKCRETNARTL